MVSAVKSPQVQDGLENAVHRKSRWSSGRVVHTLYRMIQAFVNLQRAVSDRGLDGHFRRESQRKKELTVNICTLVS